MTNAEILKLQEISFHISALLRIKDPKTFKHSYRVGKIASAFNRIFNFFDEDPSVMEDIGTIHDGGKLVVIKKALVRPGPLKGDEITLQKFHPVLGAEMIPKKMEWVREAVRHHHERLDGKGYPDKLDGSDIPEIACFFSVIDAFDAMYAERAYQKRRTFEEIKQELKDNRGKQFDFTFTNCFLEFITFKEGKKILKDLNY